MPVELVNPAGLPSSPLYSQAAVATGTRTVWVSGQVARDAAGNPVGAGDLAAQTEQAFRNVVTALGAAGATYADVVRLGVFVVDWSPEKLADFGQGAGRAAAALGLDVAPRPTTLLGVAALGEPDLLVEIEAVAVLP